MMSSEESIPAPEFVRGDQTSLVLRVPGEASSSSRHEQYILQAKIVQVTWDNLGMVKEVTTPYLNDANRYQIPFIRIHQAP